MITILKIQEIVNSSKKPLSVAEIAKKAGMKAHEIYNCLQQARKNHNITTTYVGRKYYEIKLSSTEFPNKQTFRKKHLKYAKVCVTQKSFDSVCNIVNFVNSNSKALSFDEISEETGVPRTQIFKVFTLLAKGNAKVVRQERTNIVSIDFDTDFLFCIEDLQTVKKLSQDNKMRILQSIQKIINTSEKPISTKEIAYKMKCSPEYIYRYTKIAEKEFGMTAQKTSYDFAQIWFNENFTLEQTAQNQKIIKSGCYSVHDESKKNQIIELVDIVNNSGGIKISDLQKQGFKKIYNLFQIMNKVGAIFFFDKGVLVKINIDFNKITISGIRPSPYKSKTYAKAKQTVERLKPKFTPHGNPTHSDIREVREAETFLKKYA